MSNNDFKKAIDFLHDTENKIFGIMVTEGIGELCYKYKDDDITYENIWDEAVEEFKTYVCYTEVEPEYETEEGYFDKYKNHSIYRLIEKTKPLLCGNNPIGDFFYRMSADLDCTCCAFLRGAFLSAIIFFTLGAIVF